MLVPLVRGRLVHLHIGVIFSRGKFQRITQQRSEPGEIDEQIVALAKNVRSFMSALSGCDKYANMARRD